MKTTVQALKELYAQLGGNLADVAMIECVPEMIEALRPFAVKVPEPTAEDEGKVLTVGEDGAWKASELPTPPGSLPDVTPEDAGKVLTVSEDGKWGAAASCGKPTVEYGRAVASITEKAIPQTGKNYAKVRINFSQTVSALKDKDVRIPVSVYATVRSPDGNTYYPCEKQFLNVGISNYGTAGCIVECYIPGITEQTDVVVLVEIDAVGIKFN